MKAAHRARNAGLPARLLGGTAVLVAATLAGLALGLIAGRLLLTFGGLECYEFDCLTQVAALAITGSVAGLGVGACLGVLLVRRQRWVLLSAASLVAGVAVAMLFLVRWLT